MSIGDKLERLKSAPFMDSMDRWLATLPEEERLTMAVYAPDPALSHTAFWEIAQSEGCPVGKAKFTEWRKRLGYGA